MHRVPTAEAKGKPTDASADLLSDSLYSAVDSGLVIIANPGTFHTCVDILKNRQQSRLNLQLPWRRLLGMSMDYAAKLWLIKMQPKVFD